MAPGFIRVILPPDDAIASGLVHRRCSAGGCESDVDPLLANSDIRVAAVEDYLSGFILIEAQMNKAAEVVSRLRVTLAHDGRDPAAQGVGGAGIVLDAVAQVRVQVA